MFLFPPTVGPNANLQHVTEPIKFDFTQKYSPPSFLVPVLY